MTDDTLLNLQYDEAQGLYDAGRLRDAAVACDRLLTASPQHVRAMHLMGTIMLDSSRPGDAAVIFDQVVKLEPNAPVAWLSFANALDQLDKPAEAFNARRNALLASPDDVVVIAMASAGFLRSGHVAEAVETAQVASRLQPLFPAAWFNLAVALQAAGRVDEARNAAMQAVQLVPDEPRTLGLLAQLEAQSGNPTAARKRLEDALARHPTDASLATELGYLATRNGDHELAARAYASALALQPGNGPAMSQLIFADKQMARWDRLPALQQRFAAGVKARHAWLTPFSFLSDPSTRAEQRLCAETWGAGFLPTAAVVAAPPYPPSSLRLRIGYLSGDFYQHPTSVLLAGVLEHHDRTRFEIFAYSTGPNDGSAMRKRIEHAVEHFVEANALLPDALAARIRDDKIDVLVDLKGYTEGSMLAALAQRPASVQVHWVGYPGTLAAPYIDFLMADLVVLPREHETDYGENIAWLPGSYQPNDRSREVATPVSRAELGLPANATVLCGFAAPWKLTAETFRAWLDVLARVPGSVLWMLAAGPDDPVIANLRAAAVAHGADPARLHFVTRRAPADYLALYHHADLFLDTWPYNAHTTASDALWVGVPLVTWLGDTFAGRVAASLLNTLGVPELVAADAAGFVELAVALGNDPERRTALRKRIEGARYTSTLFDARAMADAVEVAYGTMIAMRRIGKRISFDVGGLESVEAPGARIT